QGSGGRIRQAGERLTEVLVGRRAVPHLEAHGLSHAHPLTHADRPALLIDAEEAANQEVPAAVLRAVLVDHDPEQEALRRQPPLASPPMTGSPGRSSLMA